MSPAASPQTTATTATPPKDEIIQLDAVVVSGFAEGVKKSMLQSKESLNLRSVINADTMGKLPDNNAAEALSRLGSVFMDDNEGEGRYIAIRGIEATLNNVTMNGQTIAASDTGGQDGRAAPLDVLSAASISEIEIIKAITPNMDLQAVGGAINIRTRSAFENGGRPYEKVSAYIGTNTQNDNTANYGYSFAKSLTFGAKRQWGLIVSGNYSDTTIISHAYENNNERVLGELGRPYWSVNNVLNEFGNIMLFEQFVLRSDSRQRKRLGLNAAVEFRPNPDTQAWLRYYFTDSDDDSDTFRQSYRGLRDLTNRQRAKVLSPRAAFSSRARITGVWEEEFQERPVDQIHLGGKKRFGDFTIEANVVHTNAREDRANDYRIETEPVADNRSIDAFKPGRRYPFDGTGPTFNLADLRNSNAAAAHFEQPDGTVLFLLVPNRELVLNALAADNNEDITRAWPAIQHGQPMDISNVGFYDLVEHQFNPQFVEEDTQTATLDASWDTRVAGRRATFTVGGKFLNRDKFVDKESYRHQPKNGEGMHIMMNGTGNTITGPLWRPYSDVFGRKPYRYGPHAGQQTWIPDRAAMGRELDAHINLGQEFRDWNGGLKEYIAYLSALPDQNQATENGKWLGAFTDDPEESIENSVEDDYTLTEQITAFYFMFDVDLTDRMTLLGGARYEKTEASITNAFVANSIGNKPTRLLPPITTSVVYENVMPNLQLKWEVARNVIARASYTGSIGRPDYVDLGSPGNGQLSIDVDDRDTPRDFSDDEILEGEIALPNPDLKPYESSNLDLSLAKYFNDGSGYVSLGFFAKTVKNPVYEFSREETDVPLDSLVDRFNLDPDLIYLGQGHVLNPFVIETVTNGNNDQKVRGWEFEALLTFDRWLPDRLRGFGAMANYTLIDAEVVLPNRPDEVLSLEDQTDKTWNFQLFYTRAGFDARAALRYQGEAIVGFGGNRVLGRYSDRHQDDRLFLDLFFSYYLNKNLRISLSGKNLTDAAKTLYQIDPAGDRRLRRTQAFGRSYELAMTWSR